MKITENRIELVSGEGRILEELLELQGAAVLELGCGKAEKTRIVAEKAATVLALEVAEIQLAINLAIPDLPNVRFAKGCAEQIQADEESFDVVLMFKSLHHVPLDRMDDALSEIARVLKPGGRAYISEPVFAGEFNEILRLFHDERVVREAAFDAVKRAVTDGRFGLVRQKFFLQPVHFEDFASFEKGVIGVTHSNHILSVETHEAVKAAFEKHLTKTGADFFMPIRVDLLEKRA